MALEGAERRIGRWWRRCSTAERVKYGLAAFAAAGASIVVLIIALGPRPVLIGAGVLALLTLRGRRVVLRWGGASSPGEAAEAERARRRDLIARFGHVPVAELANSKAPLIEPAAPSASETNWTAADLERARRAELVQRYGRVPLTDLADPRHGTTGPLHVEGPPATSALGVGMAFGPSFTLHVGAEGGAPSSSSIKPSTVSAPPPEVAETEPPPGSSPRPVAAATFGQPIVEHRRAPWRRRPSRSGSIVE